MPLYLPVNFNASTVAVALCARCSMKMQMDDLVKDPNTDLWVCEPCCDIYDPYRLPALVAENISVPHPRKDTDIAT